MTAMRTSKDRIRHTLLFEAIALAIVTPAGALLFDLSFASMGILSVLASLVATVWNYLYNYGFDHAMLRLTGSTAKSLPLRVFHAVAFEAGMLAIMLPLVAWYLGISLYTAFMMDILLAAFFMVYAFIFNYAYDWIFPIPAAQAKTQS